MLEEEDDECIDLSSSPGDNGDTGGTQTIGMKGGQATENETSDGKLIETREDFKISIKNLLRHVEEPEDTSLPEGKSFCYKIKSDGAKSYFARRSRQGYL